MATAHLVRELSVHAHSDFHAFSESKKSLIKTSDVHPWKSEGADVVKKKRLKALSRRGKEKRSEYTRSKEVFLKQDLLYFLCLKQDLTKYLNENDRTTKSGILCIYVDADLPEKVVVETSPQEHSTANAVIKQFVSKICSNDALNQLLMKKCFEVKDQEVELQYNWNDYSRITVAGQPDGSLCSVGCLVTTVYCTQKKVGNEPVTEEEFSQEQHGYLTSASSISKEKLIKDGRLDGLEDAQYKSVRVPYSLQAEANTYTAVDAAVIKIQDGSQQGGQYQFDTWFNGPPEELERLIQSLERASPERQVYKTGSASGETVGYIQTADLSERLTFKRNGLEAPDHFYCGNVIRIRAAAGHPPFSLPGDSGAVVYRIINGKKQALGLISRCDQAGEGVTHAVYWSNCRDALQDCCDIEVRLTTEE